MEYPQAKPVAIRSLGVLEQQTGELAQTAETQAVGIIDSATAAGIFAVCTARLPPHSRMMGLDLPSGGHLTHGYYTAKKRISASPIYFETLPWRVRPEKGPIGFEEL